MKNKHKKTNDAEFAKRFRTLLGNRNLKLRDIAKATGCAVSTASTWKRGRKPKNEIVLDKLCKIFDVSLPYLLLGKKDTAEYIFANEAEDALYQASSASANEIREYVESLISAAQKCEGGLEHLRFELRRKIPLTTYLKRM